MSGVSLWPKATDDARMVCNWQRAYSSGAVNGRLAWQVASLRRLLGLVSGLPITGTSDRVSNELIRNIGGQL
jgi:hypothetical protein